MFKGFFKCEYRAGTVSNRSVMYVENGRMFGGNSAFAHLGTYKEVDGDIVGSVLGERHAVDPHVGQLYGSDNDELTIRGRLVGNAYHFDASPVRLPHMTMSSVMTRLDDEAMPAPGRIADGGIRNGLYAVRIRGLDGIEAGLTGVMLVQNGRMLGGDAFFYYLGSYSSEAGHWKGELLNQEHTPARNAIFGGHEVGIGFSGRCNDVEAGWFATALVGKRSLQLAAELRLLHAI